MKSVNLRSAMSRTSNRLSPQPASITGSVQRVETAKITQSREDAKKYHGSSFASLREISTDCGFRRALVAARTPQHHPGRVVNACTDQARMIEPLVCTPSFRLFSVKLFFDFELATSIIVRVRSTACNHGPVLRGCMIMQSTTCHSMFEVNRCRQSTA